MSATADWAYSTIPAPPGPYPYLRPTGHPFIPAPFQHLAAQRPTATLTLPRRPKILHVIGTLGPGGAELQLCHAAIGLAQRGYQVRVAVCYSLEGPAAFHLPTLQNAGIDVVAAGANYDPATRAALQRLPNIAHILHECPKWLRPMAIDLLSEMLRDPPDLVHGWMDLANVAAAAAALAARVPQILLSLHSVNPTHHLSPEAAQWYRPWYQFLATVPGIKWFNNSQAGARDYARWLNLNEQSITILHNGIDFDALHRPDKSATLHFRQTLAIPASAPLVTGVLRLSEEKQPLLFLDVVDKVMPLVPHLHCILAGGGPMEAQVRARVQASPFAERFHVLGVRNDIPLILSATDVLLQTSRIEGIPNTLLEAQGLGCPIVTTEAYGAIEALSPGHTGLVSHSSTAEDLATHLTTLLTHPELLHRFAAAGPAFVRQRFGLPRMLDELTTLYNAPI